MLELGNAARLLARDSLNGNRAFSVVITSAAWSARAMLASRACGVDLVVGVIYQWLDMFTGAFVTSLLEEAQVLGSEVGSCFIQQGCGW